MRRGWRSAPWTTQPEAEAAVDRGLDEFNTLAAPEREVFPLSCFARSVEGEVLGGAVGRISGQCCELRLLWVSSEARLGGVGAELVRRFESHAIQRGCVVSSLSTFSFQARGFYEKLGYQVRLEIPCHGPGVSKLIMLKELQAASAPNPSIERQPQT